MALNQGKYKPSVSAIDEVDDHIVKQHKQQIEGSETAPLTTNQHKLHIDNNRTQKDLEIQNEHEADAVNSASHESMNGLRGRISMDALMRLSRKRRILYLTTACLCALLLVIIIFMIVFWPEVPFYLKSKLCLEKECMEASKQLLLWANTSKDPCHETYDWACGNFAQDYAEHDYFVIKKGEWNYKTYREYHELNELNRFISMLPFTGVTYSVESMITTLFRSCREIDALDKSQSDMLLKKAINSVDGWQAFRDSNRLQFWEYKKALIQLQVTYGIFPYYKITVENRYNKPHDYIIAIDEGEIGLPDKYFYNVDSEDEVVLGYKLLLRDFAINMGIVAREAGLFADEVFHYEQRIVNHIGTSKNAVDQNQIKTLADVKTIAPSLPIIKTIQAMFPHTKITEETEVLVRNAEALSQISTVVSTSDKKPLNNYIIWSLVRHLLPHLSKEYRNLIQNFDDAVYGRTAAYPRWMICSQIVKEWLPFAVDALHQAEEHKLKSTSYLNKTQANDELLRLMFHTLRKQLQLSVNEAKWILPEVKTYIKEKLTTMRLQIGIPQEVLHNGSYIKDYYNQLVLNNLYFVEHLESIWSFRKTLMEKKLQALGIVDTIISEMYAHENPAVVAYSKILNMLIISPNIILKSYYDYKFPIAMNFARMGDDILELLVDAIALFVKQFKADEEIVTNDFDLPRPRVDCLVAQEPQKQELYELPSDTLNKFQVTLSAAKITARALSSFIEDIDDSKPIIDQRLQLKNRLRLPGLRSFNEYEVFVLAYMQKHCSTPIAEKNYGRIKPHVEQILAERYLFNATWNNIQFFHRAVSCSVPDVRCANIL